MIGAYKIKKGVRPMHRIKMLLKFLKLDLLEFVIFDAKMLALPLSLGTIASTLFLALCKKDHLAARVLESFWRRNWPLSEFFCSRVLRTACSSTNIKASDRVKALYWNHIFRSHYPEIVKKFIIDPRKFFPGMCIVLKSFSQTERGVLVLNYSYSFPLFLKLFDVAQIASRYFIVLEPSWNGYLNLDILCYNIVSEPIFVQALEPRDAKLLSQSGTNLVPVPLGSNWWVDYTVFKPIDLEKDVDIIMVASWADFKRHHKLFKTMKRLKQRGRVIRAVLIGYPVEKSLEEIRVRARYYGVEEQIEFYEWLSADEVNRQFNRARINLIWSRFEGNNRVIVEGMFANVPFILRRGFNYGYKYRFVNEKTGVYADERDLEETIVAMLDGATSYSPREWAMEHMTCHKAITILFDTINIKARQLGEDFSNDLVPKVNELHGMRYLKEEDEQIFRRDYDFLMRCLRKRK